jgi:hypothetical protein
MRPEDVLSFLNATTHFNDEKNVLYKLSPAWMLTIWICLTASLIIGWIAKYYVYLHIFNTKIKEQVTKYLNNSKECACRIVWIAQLQLLHGG